MDDQNVDNHEARAAEEAKPLGINWEDPDVPVGNAPPLAKWPVVAFATGWAVWLMFLLTMITS